MRTLGEHKYSVQLLYSSRPWDTPTARAYGWTRDPEKHVGYLLWVDDKATEIFISKEEFSWEKLEAGEFSR